MWFLWWLCGLSGRREDVAYGCCGRGWPVPLVGLQRKEASSQAQRCLVLLCLSALAWFTAPCYTRHDGSEGRPMGVVSILVEGRIRDEQESVSSMVTY